MRNKKGSLSIFFGERRGEERQGTKRGENGREENEREEQKGKKLAFFL